MQRVGSAGGARGRAGWAGSGCKLKAVPSGCASRLGSVGWKTCPVGWQTEITPTARACVQARLCRVSELLSARPRRVPHTTVLVLRAVFSEGELGPAKPSWGRTDRRLQDNCSWFRGLYSLSSGSCCSKALLVTSKITTGSGQSIPFRHWSLRATTTVLCGTRLLFGLGLQTPRCLPPSGCQAAGGRLTERDKHEAYYPPANSSAVLQNRPPPCCTARPFLGAPATTGAPSEVSARILRARNKASK